MFLTDPQKNDGVSQRENENVNQACSWFKDICLILLRQGSGLQVLYNRALDSMYFIILNLVKNECRSDVS